MITISKLVRNLWKTQEFEIKSYPPQYLLKIIACYYVNEFLYQIQPDKTLRVVPMNTHFEKTFFNLV